MENISVVGLGKLGICLSTALAYKGFSVVGVDVNPRTVQMVNDGEPPVLEPGLREMMNAARPRLTATGDLRRAVNETDVTFVIVPTPSDNDGSFSLCHVKTAGTALGKGLAHKSGYHVIVLVSTVLP